MSKKILLGSSSKFRQELFKRVITEVKDDISKDEKCKNLQVEIFESKNMVPDIDEKAIRRPQPAELTKAITTAKTDKLLEMLDENPELKSQVDILVCGDQVIGFNGTIREKPETESECKEFLQSYGRTGFPAEAFSCIEVTDLKSGKRDIQVGLAKVFFKLVPDEIVEKLIKKKEIMVCAGAFVVEDELLQEYIEKIEGEKETLQGMPKTMVKEMLLTILKKDL